MKLRKILSLLVAMIMALGCVGISAMAEETEAVAKVGNTEYTSVAEALKGAAETGAAEVKILQSVKELLTTDLEVVLKADLTITADSAVTVEFYNNGTTYDLVLGGTNGEDLTIAENVTLTVSDRIIWIGYYDNNIDVIVNGSLIGGFQLWFGGDVTVSDTGTVGSKGEALVGRRDAKLTVNGGKLEANYFSLISGTVELNNAKATTGPLWLSSNTEGAGHIILNNSELTSSGNLKMSGGASVTVTDGSALSVDGGEFGNSIIEEGCTLTIDTNSSVTANAITGAGAINIDASGFDGTEVSVLDTAGMSGFTGNVSVVNSSNADYEIGDDGKITIIEKAVTNVAEVNGVGYETLQEALKALTSGATLTLLDNVTITEPWDERYTGARINVPATINGNEKTITFACDVADGDNYHSAFRVEANGTVEFKNLTIDMSQATNSKNTNRIRAISSKAGDLIVDNCTFIGNSSLTNTRAIVYGEGAQHSPETDITVKNSAFTNWKQGITDNENAKDVGTVTITENTFNNAGVNVSASKSVTFTGNTVENAYVTITAYSNPTDLTVTATGNTLEANTGNTASTANRILVGTTIDAQEGFVVPIVGTLTCGYAENYNGFGRIWGEATGNPKESVKLELYSGEKLIATTKLNDRAEGDITLITGGVESYTWSFLMDQSQDAWWTTTWEAGQPNALVQPDKVVLYIDDVEVAENVVKMTSSDNLHPIEWKDLIGVKEAVLPNAEVANLGMVSVTANDGSGDYKFGTSYYVYDLVGNQKLTTATAPFDLNVAMQFVAKDSEEDAKANAYAEYTTDFFIKIDGIENGSFVGNGCYLAGYYPSFEAWVKIPLDGFTVENGKVYPVISSAGFDFSYVDICTSVEDFICGIYLTPEILAANPGINVNLTLGLSENIEAAKASDFKTVDEYTYDADDFKAVASIGTKKYSSLQDAIAAAEAGDTIVLLDDLKIESDLANAAKGYFNIDADDVITIDLNGKTIDVTDNSTGNFIVFYNYGDLTIKNGTVNVTSTVDRDWNAQSTIILNRGGNLTVESGTYNHNGGTDMAITLDDSGNSFGDANMTIKDGTITSTYTAIRMRMADPALNGNPGNGLVYLTVNGGTISGGSRGIWGQITNASADALGGLTVTGGTISGVNNAIRMDSDESKNIEVSISGTASINGIISGDTADYAITGGIFITKPDDAYAAEGYEFVANEDGTYGVVEAPEVELFDYYGSSATLGSSLAMNFYVADSNLEGTDYYAEIKHYAEDEIITTTIPYSDWTVPSRGYHMFTYSNLAARQIADKLEVTIYTGDGTQVSVVREDSLRAYAFRGFDRYAGKADITDKESKTLTALVDMLNYGAAAQVEFGYNTENPANADTEDYQQYATKSVSLTDIREMDENVYGTSLTLKDKILLSGYFSNITEGMYAKVQFTDHYGNEYDITVNYDEFVVNGSYHQIVVDELAIADAAVPVTITIYDEQGNVHSKLVESVNSYLSRAVEKYGNDTIYEKIAKFALSALNAL